MGGLSKLFLPCNKIHIMRNKRDRLGIIALILESLVESRGLTELMYKARLDTRTATKYLRLLLDNGLVACSTGKEYLITEKGLRFLSIYKELLGMISIENYNSYLDNYSIMR